MIQEVVVIWGGRGLPSGGDCDPGSGCDFFLGGWL